MMNVTIYSDGSSRGNPGPGGFGTVLHYVTPKGELVKLELSKGYAETTGLTPGLNLIGKERADPFSIQIFGSAY